jgi:hypothetical protein
VDITWFAPPAVLAAGAAAAAVLVRRIAQEVADLSVAQRRLGRMEDALIPVRVEAERARRSIDRIERR